MMLIFGLVIGAVIGFFIGLAWGYSVDKAAEEALQACKDELEYVKADNTKI